MPAMPKTLIDAIIITRHLGLRYLWSDSLCICQDDAQDWTQESSRMCSVYSNAHLVIGATRSSDGEGGCFHIRELRSQAHITIAGRRHQVHATLLYPSNQHVSSAAPSSGDEPLYQRGW